MAFRLVERYDPFAPEFRAHAVPLVEVFDMGLGSPQAHAPKLGRLT